MTQEQINEKIEELFNNTKSRGFLHHLIKAYFPLNKGKQVLETPKGPFRCAITGTRLISSDDVLKQIHSEDFKEKFMSELKGWIDGNTMGESTLKKTLKGRVLGFTGDKTNTYLCQEAYQGLYNWISRKILMGDKHINWLMKDMAKDMFMDRAEKVANTKEEKAAVKRINKVKNSRATTSLGDFDILKDLKKKMESGNN